MSEEPTHSSHIENEPRKRRRWLRFILFASPLALLLIAPTIVAKTSLRNSVAGWALGDVPVKVEIGQAGLSWFAPVSFDDVQVTHEDGELIASVPKVICDRTLWQLATGRYEKGNVRISRPELHCRVRSDGSNLEDVIAGFMEGEPSESSSIPPLTIEIEDALLSFSHKETGSRSQIQGLHCLIEQTRDSPLPSISATGRWTSLGDVASDSTDGVIQANLQAENEAPARWQFQATELAAGFIEPLLQRLYPQARMSGFLNGKLDVVQDLTEPTQRLTAGGMLKCRNFAASIPELLGNDRVFLDQADLNGNVALKDQVVRFDNVNLRSRIANISAKGDLVLPGSVPTEMASEIQDLEIIGSADLPGLSAMLPETLRLHKDVKVDAGKLLVRVKTGPTNFDGIRGRNWIADAKVTQIAGRHGNKTIQWEDPVTVHAVAAEANGELFIDQLRCDSTFLKMTGQGDSDHVELDGECNLNALMANVSQFVDLGQFSAAGRMEIQGSWDRLTQGRSKLVANATVTDFLLTSPLFPALRERHLVISTLATLNAPSDANVVNASFVESQLDRLDEFKGSLQAGQDRLTADLLRTASSTKNDLPLRIELLGDLKSWMTRLNPIVNLEPLRASGRIAFVGTTNISPERIKVSDSTLSVDDLAVTNGDIAIRDEHVDGSLTFELNHQASTGFADVTLNGKTLNAKLTQLKVDYGNQFSVAGDVELSAKLQSAMKLTNGPRLSGDLASRGRITNTGDRTEFALVGSVQDFIVSNRVVAQTRIAAVVPNLTTQSFSEPELKFVAKGHHSGELLNLDGLTLKASSLGVSTKGKVRTGQPAMTTDLTGEIGYELESLSRMISLVTGLEIQATGTGRQPFYLRGPVTSVGNQPAGMIPPGLEAGFALDWQTIDVDRLKFGEGQLQGQLQKRILRFDKTTFDVKPGGRVTVQPILTLDGDQPVLHLNQESSISEVVITPEIANHGLAYITPLLANTTNIDGRMSGVVTKATIPLFDPMKGDIGGRIQIDHAVARPGPVAQRLAGTIQQIKSLIRRGNSTSSIADKTLVKMNRQTVDFRMVNRQVHHRGLTFTIDDFPIRTSGVVGLDQRIALTAEISIRPKWVENDRILKRLAEKPLSIPISGTLSKPVIDPRILSNLTRQLGSSAIEGLINDKIGGSINDQINDKIGGKVNEELDRVLKNKLGGALDGLFRRK